MNKERSILLYGPPASGKSTVAKETSNLINSQYLSVGDMTREEITNGTDIGAALKKYLDAVTEYPVELISSVVEKRIVEALETNGSFILDGFPKYSMEAEAFIGLMQKHNFTIDTVAVIEVPFEEALLRVANRRICEDCLAQTQVEGEQANSCEKCGGTLIVRDDDRPEILERRYRDYVTTIAETLSVLEGHFVRLVKIDGTNDKQTVVEEFARVAQQ